MSQGPGDPHAPTVTVDRDEEITRESEEGLTEPGDAPPRDGSGDAPRPRLPAPLQYRDRDRYSVIDEHGRGGLGRVMRARDRELGRTVAIKELLKPGQVGELRFFREALITARLEHPGIVPVHEAGRWSDGTPFYTMKLVAGRPLRELIDGARNREDSLALVRHVVSVADALSYAHAHGIVHRDVKPSNILVGDFGETVVIDWGLAKSVDQGSDQTEDAPPEASPSSHDLTQVGAVLGTPAFMSPEQSKGLPVDARTDVYALGVVLREIVERKGARARGAGAYLLGRWERAELVSIASRATAADPASRYGTMSAFADDVRHQLTSQRVAAHKYSALQRIRRHSRAHPLLTVAFIVGLAASAVIAAGFSAILIREQERTLLANDKLAATLTKLTENQQDLILQQAKVFMDSDPTSTLAWLKLYQGPLVDKAQEYAASALARGVATSVMPHPGNPAAATWLDEDASVALITMSSGSLIRWAPSSGSKEVTSLLDQGLLSAVSPRTGLILFGTGDGELRIYDDTTGAQRILHAVKAPIVALAMTTDGHNLFAADSAGTLLVGRPTEPLEAIRSPVPIHRAVPSPDYASILVCGTDGRLFVYQRSSRRFKAVDFACSGQNEVPLVYSPDGTKAVVVGERGLARLDVSTGRTSGYLSLPNIAFGEVASDDDAAIMTVDGEIHRVPFEPEPARLVFSSETPFSSVHRHGGAAPALLIGATDGSALRFDLVSDSVVRHDVHPRSIASIAVDRTGTRALTTDLRETRVWRIPVTQSWRLPSRASFRAVYTSDGATVFTDSQDGSVFEVNTRTGGVTRHSGHAGIVFGIRMDLDGSVLSAGWDGTVRRWRNGRSTVVATHPSQVRHFATTRRDLITIDERSVVFTDRATSAVRTIAFPEAPYRVAASETATMIMTSQGGVFIVEPTGPRQLDRHGPGKGDVVYIASIDRFASTGRDGRVAVWSGNGQLLQEHRVAKTCGVMAVSTAGHVSALCNRNMVVLIDARSGSVIFARETNPEVYNVAFSPAADYMAASFVGGEAYFWKLSDLSLAVGPGGRGSLTSIQFSPDGSQALATSFSGRLFLWNLNDMQFVPLNATWFTHSTNISIDTLRHPI